MKIYRIIYFFIALALTSVGVRAQAHLVKGTVIDTTIHKGIAGVYIDFRTVHTQRGQHNFNNILTDTAGRFQVSVGDTGMYQLYIAAYGYEPFTKVISVKEKGIIALTLPLVPKHYELEEVKVISKIIPVVQNGDTTEYNAGAYKLNPDADAADLLRKMPNMEIADRSIKAQGERVVKIYLDGKPFWTGDPYTAIKSLPAEMVEKIQLYNGLTDEAQFSGLGDGQKIHTINIMTKANKRNGLFGKLSAGDADNGRYFTSVNLNRFNNDHRISVNLSANNIDAQDFADDALLSMQYLQNTQNRSLIGGINYNDKWGKKIDVNACYFVNNNTTNSEHELERDYTINNSAATQYKEHNATRNNAISHKLNARINYDMDKYNSLLITPDIGVQQYDAQTSLAAKNTTSGVLTNAIANSYSSKQTAVFSHINLLFRHKFKTGNQRFQLSVDMANNAGNTSGSRNNTDSVFSPQAAANNLNQLLEGHQSNKTASGRLEYTRSLNPHNDLQIVATASFLQGTTDNSATSLNNGSDAYALDTAYSVNSMSITFYKKIGANYQFKSGKLQLSIGAHYQATDCYFYEWMPVSAAFNKTYNNILYQATFQAPFLENGRVYVDYNSGIVLPVMAQLQDALNIGNSLYYTTGNKDLREEYRNNCSIKYTNVNKVNYRTFNIALSAVNTTNYIAGNTIFLKKDSLVGAAVLPANAQISYPVNVNGYWSISGYMGCSFPTKPVGISMSLSSSVMQKPAMVNNVRNNTHFKNIGLLFSLNSNSRPDLDVNFSASCSYNSFQNFVAEGSTTSTYLLADGRLSVAYLYKNSFTFSSQANYHLYAGASDHYQQTNFYWNMAVGKKIFKDRSAEIKLTVYDILNQHLNQQRNISETYTEYTQSDAIGRLMMLSFIYQLKTFK